MWIAAVAVIVSLANLGMTCKLDEEISFYTNGTFQPTEIVFHGKFVEMFGKTAIWKPAGVLAAGFCLYYIHFHFIFLSRRFCFFKTGCSKTDQLCCQTDKII